MHTHIHTHHPQTCDPVADTTCGRLYLDGAVFRGG
jgi:hypothetical protein